MQLHVLWTHNMHCEHRMEFLLIPLQHTAHGYLPDFWRTAWSSPETGNLVFFMITRSPLRSMPVFHALSLEIHHPHTTWSTCLGWPAQPIPRPRLLKAHHMTFLGAWSKAFARCTNEGKVEWFLNCDVFLLQLQNNESGVSFLPLQTIEKESNCRWFNKPWH